GRVKILTIIDGEWEEVQSFPGFLGAARGHQHYGFAVADQRGAVSLFCQLSDFDRELSLADHRADFVYVHDCLISPLQLTTIKKRPRSDAPGRSSSFQFSWSVTLQVMTLYFRIPSLEITSR